MEYSSLNIILIRGDYFYYWFWCGDNLILPVDLVMTTIMFIHLIWAIIYLDFDRNLLYSDLNIVHNKGIYHFNCLGDLNHVRQGLFPQSIPPSTW